MKRLAVALGVLVALLVPSVVAAQAGCTFTVEPTRLVVNGCNVVRAGQAQARVNVPLLLDAAEGDTRLDANAWGIVWAGSISPNGGYSQARIIGRSDGVMVYVPLVNAACPVGVPYAFDVTEIVKRAYAGGRTSASMLLYTAAGQYHSGKYFWGNDAPRVSIAYTTGAQPTWTATAQPTPIPTSTRIPPTATPTAQPTVGPTATIAPPAANGCTFYISKTGKDTNPGTTLAAAWATFGRAPHGTQPLWTGHLQNNVFRDVVAADNVGVGFQALQPYSAGTKANNVVERATIYGNGSSIEPWERAQGGNVYVGMPGVTVRTGGAQIGRYVDRVKQAGPVWEMQGRALAELGVDVAALWRRYGGVE